MAAFKAIAPQVTTVVAFGNCDAAAALMLAQGAGCDGLVLSNPWVIDDEDSDDDTPPASAIRARYLHRLKNPRELLRLVTGKVDFRKLLSGLRKASNTKSEPSSLAAELRDGIAKYSGSIQFLLAENDRTAQTFLESWDKSDERIAQCEGAGHAYVEPHAAQWLQDHLLAALRSQRSK